MMYKNETLKKFVAKAREQMFDAMKDPEKLHVRFSYGNRKIGRCLNISLLPILTCSNCHECKHYCYDIKADLLYTNAMNARVINTAIARSDMDRYFAEISQKMDRRRVNKFMRFHVAGDILNMAYFEKMVEIARKHADFTIWTYTKNYRVVNEWIDANGCLPKNLVVMFSKWDGMPMENPHNQPVFYCKLASGNKDTTEQEFAKMFKCPGNCDICKENHCGCIAGQTTYADEH